MTLICHPSGLLSAASASGASTKTYLLVGYDDAAENTDTICIANFNFDKNEINVLQIPRDTYYGFGHSQNKINQFYSYERAKGSAPNSAMRSLASSLSKHLSLKIDGFMGISTDSFEKIISAIGGIYVDAESDFSITDSEGNLLLSLAKGENFITSRQAMILARHRASYKRGDLQRMDAQKMLIKGLYKTLGRGIDYKSLPALISSADGIVTDMSVIQILSLLRLARAEQGMSVSVQTLPGEAVVGKNGISYYVMNRANAARIFNNYFSVSEEHFDAERIFNNPSAEEFSRIYYNTN